MTEPVQEIESLLRPAGWPEQAAGTEPPVTFTREQVSDAVNAGADLVVDGLGVGEAESDLVNLVVNAIVAVLESPGISLDDVIRQNYETDPAEVRGWWSWGS
jgi:hypothetical protein